ncbi:MAG: GTP-binding protein [Curvibacter sp.]
MRASPEASMQRIVICGAAGRDFHNFNTVYRGDAGVRVVAFTATQIPGIDARRYPASLAGTLYPEGIDIVPEAELESLCQREHVDTVVFAYSDVTHAQVMHLASRALAVGCNFALLGPQATMLASHKPVVAVSAVRTGCGKSQTARHLAQALKALGLRVAVIRHPMPYGDLARQRVQAFHTVAQLDADECTIEEREEYEPHLAAGHTVFAGVDYAAILAAAEETCDIIVWDGGNNDFPFLRPTVHVVVCDALRPDQLATHHPGEAVLRMADLVVLNKVDAAPAANVASLEAAALTLRPGVPVVRAASPIQIDAPQQLLGRRVLVVEDGPTLTHGGMAWGAGYSALRKLAGVEIVDPRESAAPNISRVYAQYPHIGPVLPAMGYGAAQLTALRATVNTSRAEVVLSATPIDLARLGGFERPIVRARYGYADTGSPTLATLVAQRLDAAA